MPSTKILFIIFIVASLSPIIAAMVLPSNYSFYMFFPAKPDTVFDRFRLTAGNMVLVFGFGVSLVAAAILVARGFKQRKYLTFICPLVIFFNPLQQPIFLESLDTYLNYKWRDRAQAQNIIGKTPADILALYGKPIREWTEAPKVVDRDGKITWQGEKYTGWEYQPLPFYLCGSRFQVFFVNGKVENFEANDD